MKTQLEVENGLDYETLPHEQLVLEARKLAHILPMLVAELSHLEREQRTTFVSFKRHLLTLTDPKEIANLCIKFADVSEALTSATLALFVKAASMLGFEINEPPTTTRQ